MAWGILQCDTDKLDAVGGRVRALRCDAMRISWMRLGGDGSQCDPDKVECDRGVRAVRFRRGGYVQYDPDKVGCGGGLLQCDPNKVECGGRYVQVRCG